MVSIFHIIYYSWLSFRNVRAGMSVKWASDGNLSVEHSDIHSEKAENVSITWIRPSLPSVVELVRHDEVSYFSINALGVPGNYSNQSLKSYKKTIYNTEWVYVADV